MNTIVSFNIYKNGLKFEKFSLRKITIVIAYHLGPKREQLIWSIEEKSI